MFIDGKENVKNGKIATGELHKSYIALNEGFISVPKDQSTDFQARKFSGQYTVKLQYWIYHRLAKMLACTFCA